MCLEYFIDLSSYKDQKNILSTLEMDLATTREEGFVSKNFMDENNTTIAKGLTVVIGIMIVYS